MKKINVGIFLFILIFTGVLLSGCLIEKEKVKKSKINIGGSSSGIIILTPIAALFEEKYQDYKVNFLPGTETQDGIRGVSKGLLDIGSQARQMTEAEKDEFPNVAEILFVKDVMVIGVNRDVNVTSLTSDQIRKIYSGEITDWSQVGGKNEAIVVLGREESDSSQILLREKILGKELNITGGSIMLHSASSMNKAIEEMKGSIGVSSYSAIISLNLSISMVAVDGVFPSPEAVKDSDYPLVRTYGLTLPNHELAGIDKDFVDFIFSEESRQKLIGSGLVPIKRD